MKFLKQFLSITLITGVLAGFLTQPARAASTITIVDGGVGFDNASLELNTNDFPVISYYDTLNHVLKVAVCGNATCTTSTITIVDGNGSVGQYPSLKLNANDYPVISYYDYTNGALKVAICGDVTCAARTTTIVDSGVTNVGWYSSLALNASGFPVISYYDYTNSALKVAVCGNTTCTTSTITVVDNTGWVGWYTSLALNANDFPVISYYDIANSALKVAICGDPNCATRSIITLDNAGDVGWFPSLVLSANSYPIISYWDSTNADLKIAVCGDATCTNSTISVVDGAGFVGPYPSMELNASGQPVISYESILPATNTIHLKVVICGNTNCNSQKTFFDVGSGVAGSLALSADGFPVIGFHNEANGDLRLALLTVPVGASTATPDSGTTISSLPKTGFAPNRLTSLPPQPASLAYNTLSDIWLEIPSLKVKSTIVGVPKTNNTWKLDWLGNDTGWLNGTAFPTWEGNSVLTAHVYNASGLPGPFVNLNQLKYGNKIIVHFAGQKYIFEVTKSVLTRPGTTRFAYQHLKNNAYLTLITCQGYDEKTNTYQYRRVVRAVLVEVQWDK